MYIEYDGLKVELQRGETLYDGIVKAKLTGDLLSNMPLAAMIGGDVYSLDFKPDSDTSLKLIFYGDEEGMRVYERTLQFVLLMAMKRLYPNVRVFVNCTMNYGLHVTTDKEGGLLPFEVLLIKDECRRVVEENIPIVKRRVGIDEALARFEAYGRKDRVGLIKSHAIESLDIHEAGGEYADCLYGDTAISTGCAFVFDLLWLEGGMMLMLPDRKDPNRPAKFIESPKIFATFRKSDAWGKLMRCGGAAELNLRVKDGSIHELIRVNEALHEREFAKIADLIAQKKAKAVLIAGPSSSGKTTSANRIATQLRVLGLDPVMLSLDNYYIDRSMCPRDEYGNFDFEHIKALDVERFDSDLCALMDGLEAEIPEFDFKTGKRREKGRAMRLLPDQPLIIEGIHGLNPLLIGEIANTNRLFRVYVTALTTLNLDDHNRIKTTDVRLFRRIVRDFETRNSSVEHTLSMWPSVREGEERWIFKYQEEADYVFNSTLHYEICVLKKYLYPLLREVPKESEYSFRTKSMLRFLDHFTTADVEKDIPPTSILREFIGGNTFYT